MGFSGLAQVLINNLTLAPPSFPWVWGWMQWRDGGLPLHTSLLSRDPQLWARNTQIHRDLGLARLCFSHRLRCPVICTLQEGSCSRSPSDKCWGQAGTQARPAHYPLPLTAPQCSLALHHCSLAPMLCVPSCSLRRQLKRLLCVRLGSRHGEQSREQRPRTLVPRSWGSLITGDRPGKCHACPTSSGWRRWGRPRTGSSQPAWSFSSAGVAAAQPRGLPTLRPHSSDLFVSRPRQS